MYRVLGAVIIIIIGYTSQLGAVESVDAEQDLKQGWTLEDRQEFYHLTQGSQLIPYKWFLALEPPADSGQPNQQLRFLDFVTQRFGFLADAPNLKNNPKGLPVGFTKDGNEKSGEWLGLTCAACHTGQVTYKKNNGEEIRQRIDGGAALIDFMGFLQFMVRSLEETVEQQDKFERFANEVIKPPCENGKDVLRKDVKNYSEKLKDAAGVGEDARNYTPHPYGFGRVDAFGLLTNEILNAALGDKPENELTLDAPVSYPSLWYTPQLDWVQWNGSVSLPMVRNLVQAIGVFGLYPFRGTVHRDPCSPEEDPSDTMQEKDPHGPKPYPLEKKRPIESSVNLKNLATLEKLIMKLKAPPWPQDILGNFNQEKIDRGKKIYQKSCEKCHKSLQKNTVTTVSKIPVSKIKTDKTMATNFAFRCASGEIDLRPIIERDRPPWVGKKIIATIASPMEELLGEFACTTNVVQNWKPASLQVVRVGALVLSESNEDYHDVIKWTTPVTDAHPYPNEKPGNVLVYIARPLPGVWATAPFLHNGSVPNLDQLLRPAEERDEKFCVGSREFNPELVGFDTGDADKCDGAFLFDTTLPGNSNAGHVYGTKLDDKGRKDLIEYLKQLGSDDQAPQ